jgi:hypothetical protein
LEVDGKPAHTFMAGEGFAEAPGEVHNFRNASTTACSGIHARKYGAWLRREYLTRTASI